MEVKNCRKCRKLFNYTSGPQICPVCRDALERKFMEVKDYIRENTGASVEEVMEACGVDKNQIAQWVREERLAFGDDSPVEFACENCGASIKTGRFCEKCKAEVASGLLNSMAKSEAPAPKPSKDKGGPKMRFLDR